MFWDIWNCGGLLYALYLIFYIENDENVAYLQKKVDKCGAIGHKLLQFLLMYDGFFSEDGKKKFVHVFEQCETHGWEETRQIYMEEFGRTLEEDFLLTEKSLTPVGSGSIGQVYKLYHKERGVYVALKVKHPGIDSQAYRFIRNISRVLYIMEWVRHVPFSLLIKEFLNNIHSQLDYPLEAMNTIVMQENFKDEPHILVPEVFEVSNRVIVMSYHEGVPYTELEQKGEQNKVSLDMYYFMLTSMLVNDFIHCDMHYGNWKVAFDPDYHIIIYDCGIISSTGCDRINKEVVLALFDGDYTALMGILAPNLEHEKKGEELRRYITEIKALPFASSSDRFAGFLKKALTLGVQLNSDVLRGIQAVMMCMSFTRFAINKMTKAVGTDGDCKEVILCYNYEILKRIGKYKNLASYIESWKNENPMMETVFLNWMEEALGHKDVEVLIDVTVDKLLGICPTGSEPPAEKPPSSESPDRFGAPVLARTG